MFGLILAARASNQKNGHKQLKQHERNTICRWDFRYDSLGGSHHPIFWICRDSTYRNLGLCEDRNVQYSVLIENSGGTTVARLGRQLPLH